MLFQGPLKKEEGMSWVSMCPFIFYGSFWAIVREPKISPLGKEECCGGMRFSKEMELNDNNTTVFLKNLKKFIIFKFS